MKQWTSNVFSWAFPVMMVFSFQAEARKVLLVSDIDDTIKVSHVLNKVEKFTRAVDTSTVFLGMPQLYQLIANENPGSTKIAYLSNAPEEIVGIPAASITHKAFLENNHFPEGELLLRENIFDSSHKINSLRELITSEMPDVLILIGDNGEKDVDVYRQATLEFANLKNMQVVTFIHQLYKIDNAKYVLDWIEEIGRTPYAEQIGYVTPIEISLKLRELGFLSQDKVDWMVQNIAPFIVNEEKAFNHQLSAMTFPQFGSCEDFKWSAQRSSELAPLIQKIEKECN